MPAVAAAREVDLLTVRDGVNEVFWPYMVADYRPASPKALCRFLVLMGGAGSGKSRFAAQDAVIRCMTERDHVFLIMRKVGVTLRASCFTLVQRIIHDLGFWKFVKVNKSDMTITFHLTGSVMLFVGLDDVEKLKSIEGVTSIWLEEATEFHEGDLNQIDLRLRSSLPVVQRIVLTFNPISLYHWLKARFWDRADPDAQVLVTTYRNNRFLNARYAAQIEGYRELDETFWRVYACGEWGLFKGLIYSPWPNAQEWPSSFDVSAYGLDFGFNNPTALIHGQEYDGKWYLTEDIYESGLTTEDIGNRLVALRVSKTDPIYADSAEPDRIAALRKLGYNIKPADKGPGSVAAGIMTVKAATVYTKPENANLNREQQTYKWAEDKNGKSLDVPVKINDHAMDAVRYLLHTYRPKKYLTVEVH